MDLNNMKAVWSEMSEQLQRQQLITDELILKMAREKSSSRLNRIILAETIGIMVCILLLIYLVIHFRQLDNWLNITGGIGTALILIISLTLGFVIVRQARKIDVAQNSYQQTLEDFGKLKKILGFYKKLSIVVNVVFPFFLLPVVFQLFLHKDILTDLPQFGLTLLLCFTLTPPALYLVIRFYKKNITEVKDALQDLNRRR